MILKLISHRYRYASGDGDLDLNNLFLAIHKVWNAMGEFETICDGKNFKFWLQNEHPEAPYISPLNFVGSRFHIAYEASCPILVMFPFYV